jgi:hypothetical protein
MKGTLVTTPAVINLGWALRCVRIVWQVENVTVMAKRFQAYLFDAHCVEIGEKRQIIGFGEGGRN